MSELLPCPFCGGEAVNDIDDETAAPYVVTCTRCAARTDWQYTPEEAAIAWNRRTPTSLRTWFRCEVLGEGMCDTCAYEYCSADEEPCASCTQMCPLEKPIELRDSAMCEACKWEAKVE